MQTRLALEPFEELIVASDRSAGRPRADHVLRIEGSTRTVAALSVRRAGGVSPEVLSAESLPALRELVARGLLVPAHG